MGKEPSEIFREFSKCAEFKAGLGTRGMYEQTRINERFFVGDQWHGAKCGNERPLVRHNIIKRIGDYKMAQVLASPVSVSFNAEGVPNTIGLRNPLKDFRSKIMAESNFRFEGTADHEEINLVMAALSRYQKVTAERVGFNGLCEKVLKNAYISGSSVIYTYWDNSLSTGLYADSAHETPIKGDISCEVLNIEDVYFADAYTDDIEKQPFIIISSRRPVDEVKREAAANGADSLTLSRITTPDDDGKIQVLTKLYKEYKDNGAYTLKCIKVTEKAVVRSAFDTRLTRYPIALFCWEKRGSLVYGESEVTYLIPNQIAINRMITAGVWSAMATGMPLMVVNGDTVTDEITNDPGQIIKIFGSNEDVEGAVKYVTPPDFSVSFGENINQLIENTLTQSGANEAALGDSEADNASALITLRDAAALPLQLVKNRFYGFVEELARIWADFWISQYGNRYIKITDENGSWYMPFEAERYKNLMITTRVDVGSDTAYSASESIKLLSSLYEKEIINKKQFLERLPQGLISDVNGIISEISEEDEQKNETEDKNERL